MCIKAKHGKGILLLISIVCIIIVAVLLINGRDSKNGNEEVYRLLVEGDWVGKNGGDSATIYFTENKEFGYYCSCGSPVDDFDLYDKYTLKDNDEIKVYGSIYRTTLKIKSIDKEKMVLEVDGELREFRNANFVNKLSIKMI